MKYFNDFIAESTILFDIDEYSELLDKYSSFKPYKGELSQLSTYFKIVRSFFNKIEKELRSQAQSDIERDVISKMLKSIDIRSLADEFYDFLKRWVDNIKDNSYLQQKSYILIPEILPDFESAAILIDLLNRSKSQMQKLITQAEIEISKNKNTRYSSKLINFANSKGVHPDVVLFANKFIRTQTSQDQFIPVDVFPLLKNLFVNPKLLPKQLYRGGKISRRWGDYQELSNDQLLKLVYDRKVTNSSGQYSSWTTDKKLAITFSSAPENDYYRYLLTLDINAKTLPYIIADLRQLTWSDYYAEQEILVDNNALSIASIEQITEHMNRASHTFTESIMNFFFNPNLGDFPFPINIQEEISQSLNVPLTKTKLSDLYFRSLDRKTSHNAPLFVCLFIEYYSHVFPNGSHFDDKTNSISWNYTDSVSAIATFKKVSLNYSEIEIVLSVKSKSAIIAKDLMKMFIPTKRVKINCRIEYT